MNAARLLAGHAAEFRAYIVASAAAKLLDAGSTVIVLSNVDAAREGVPLSRFLIHQMGLVPAAATITVLGIAGSIVAAVCLDVLCSINGVDEGRRRQMVAIAYAIVAVTLSAVGVHNLSLLFR